MKKKIGITLTIFLFLGLVAYASGASLLTPGVGGAKLQPFDFSLITATYGNLIASLSLVVNGTTTLQNTSVNNLTLSGTCIGCLLFGTNSASGTITAVSSTPYIGLTGTSTVNLPSATSSQGQVFIVKDESGNSPVESMIIKTSTSTQLIERASSSYSITTSTSAVRLISNGSNWFLW